MKEECVVIMQTKNNSAPASVGGFALTRLTEAIIAYRFISAPYHSYLAPFIDDERR